MTPEMILEQVAADGVRLVLSANGGIKASGDHGALTRWLPIIQAQKPALVAALHAASARPIQPGETLTWQRSDLSIQTGVVDYLYTDETAIRWGCVTLKDGGWAFVNLTYAHRTERLETRTPITHPHQGDPQ